MVRQLEAVIFDWAGTTVDHGSLAPIKAVTEAFAQSGIQLSDEDARRDMGLYKKDHIRNILQIPSINTAWQTHKGAAPSEADVEALFAQFIPMQFKALDAHSGVIEGVPATVDALRTRGLKIGSTTGYTRPMLDILVASAAKQGYKPDIALCPDDVGGGRPLPWMCLRIALEFKLSSLAAAVKAGDTPSDIAEARNAGMWAVGIAATGNTLGLTAEQLAALSAEDRSRRINHARQELAAAGAHYVIESVAAITSTIDSINTRLAEGAMP